MPESVGKARRWMLAFVQEHSADHDLHGRVALAFTEAFTNAVRHAYVDVSEEDISVFADVDDGTLEIVVVDHGVGMRPDPSTGGLGAGLKIVAQCADAFAIRERIPSGIEVWMKFELSPAG